MPEAIIRPATEADIPAIREIAEAAWTPVYDEFERRLGDDLFTCVRPRGVKAKPDEVEQVFREHPDCMLVTEVEGEVVAFATFFVVNQAAGVGEIGNNAVRPDCQGRGYGTAQYRRIFAELRKLGCRYVCVNTGLDEAHAPARRAYEAAGFDRELPTITYYREL